MSVLLYGLTAWGPSLSGLTFLSRPVPPSFSTTTPVQEEASTTPPSVATTPLFQYIEVAQGCGPHFEGTCVNMRGGPGEEYPVVLRLRTGVVLKVKEVITQNGQEWYKISFDGSIHFPERVTGDWYVARTEYVKLFSDEGDKELPTEEVGTSTKSIIVNLSEQMLYAYDGDDLFMKVPISAGLEETPTPRGKFFIYKKTPSRYMQGPIQGVSDQYFDLPGVPWNLYFTNGGAVIHGAYWHNSFGNPWSHGCVNLPPQEAKKLYRWADVDMPVIVRD